MNIQYIKPLTYSNIAADYNSAEKTGKYLIYSTSEVTLTDSLVITIQQSIELLNFIDEDWGVLGCSDKFCGRPTPVMTVDDNLLIVKASDNVVFDEKLGNYLYGLDACMQFHIKGRNNYAIGNIAKGLNLGINENQYRHSAAIITNNYKKYDIEHSTGRFKNIAVIMQLFFYEQWPEMKIYLNSIQQDYDLYITLLLGSDKDSNVIPTIQDIKAYKPDTDILYSENIGMDIGQTFVTMKHILKTRRTYRHYLKLHSKHSTDDWRKELISPVCGTAVNVTNAINLLKLKNVGMVGSKKWLIQVRQIDKHTKNNIDIIAEYVKRLKWKNVTIEGNQFIGGTIFWVKGCIWECFFRQINIDRTYKDFNGGRSSDSNVGTHEHSIERLFGIMVAENNLIITGV